MKTLVSISTRGRYFTTLPLAIQSIINQTWTPTKLIIFDDNDEPIDLRENQVYQYLFQILDFKMIEWEVVYGERKGQHYNHQKANTMGYDLVFRLDDDCVAMPDVLRSLAMKMIYNPDVGAVGCSILTPPVCEFEGFGSITDIDKWNKQWSDIAREEEVDHLHCSFMYRAGIVDYNLNLSKVAHREETLFTYGLKTEGYKNIIIPGIIWHLKNKEGGIRNGQAEMFAKDENIFEGIMKYGKIIVLNNGFGDHIVFKKLLPAFKQKYPKLTIACCYPDLFDGEQVISIAEAEYLLGNLDRYNVYKWMSDNDWKYGLMWAYTNLYKIG